MLMSSCESDKGENGEWCQDDLQTKIIGIRIGYFIFLNMVYKTPYLQFKSRWIWTMVELSKEHVYYSWITNIEYYTK